MKLDIVYRKVIASDIENVDVLGTLERRTYQALSDVYDLIADNFCHLGLSTVYVLDQNNGCATIFRKKSPDRLELYGLQYSDSDKTVEILPKTDKAWSYLKAIVLGITLRSDLEEINAQEVIRKIQNI